MTEAANIERQKRQQAEFVTDDEHRLLEIEDARLAIKFGDKKRYSNQENEAIRQELIAAGLDDEERRDPDAIEAVFRKLNEIDEVAKARYVIVG
jgi:SOS response regulatory protein OraA/RecX